MTGVSGLIGVNSNGQRIGVPRNFGNAGIVPRIPSPRGRGSIARDDDTHMSMSGICIIAAIVFWTGPIGLDLVRCFEIDFEYPGNLILLFGRSAALLENFSRNFYFTCDRFPDIGPAS